MSRIYQKTEDKQPALNKMGNYFFLLQYEIIRVNQHVHVKYEVY